MLHLCTAESPEEHAFPLLYNVMRHFRIPPRTRSRWRILIKYLPCSKWEGLPPYRIRPPSHAEAWNSSPRPRQGSTQRLYEDVLASCMYVNSTLASSTDHVHWRPTCTHTQAWHTHSTHTFWERTSPWINEYIRVQQSNPVPTAFSNHVSNHVILSLSAGSIQSYDTHPISIITLVFDFHNILYLPPNGLNTNANVDQM